MQTQAEPGQAQLGGPGGGRQSVLARRPPSSQTTPDQASVWGSSPAGPTSWWSTWSSTLVRSPPSAYQTYFDMTKEIAQAESRDHNLTSRDKNCHNIMSFMSIMSPVPKVQFDLRQHGNVGPDIQVGESGEWW